jgi:hypothetical protein
VDGVRDGRWTFFHDAKETVRMATGSFLGGVLVDEWRHFDADGKLIGRSRPEPSAPFEGAGYLVHAVPRDELGQHWVHEADIAGTRHRLDFLADGNERIYVRDVDDVAYEADGHKMSRLDGLWESSDCWSPLRKAVASAGDVVTLHGILFKHPDVCDAGKPVPMARGRHIEAMLVELRREGAVQPGAGAGIAEVVSSSLASFVAKPGVESTPGS